MPTQPSQSESSRSLFSELPSLTLERHVLQYVASLPASLRNFITLAVKQEEHMYLRVHWVGALLNSDSEKDQNGPKREREKKVLPLPLVLKQGSCWGTWQE